MPKRDFFIVTHEDGIIWIDGIKKRNPPPELLALMADRWRATVMVEDGHYSVVEEERKK